jgi:hypothetical protein
MGLFIQSAGAIVAIVVADIFFAGGSNPAPAGVYVVAAMAGGAAAQWLYARWKYGRDVTVTFSRKIDRVD